MVKSKSKIFTKKRFSKKFRAFKQSKLRPKSHNSDKITNISFSQKSKSSDLNIKPQNEQNEKYELNLTLVNWADKFLNDFSVPKEKKEEFKQNFFNSLKKLCLTKNEFVVWIMNIEFFSKNNFTDIFTEEEILFYIGLYSKELLGNDINKNNNININKENFEKVKLILEKNNISNITFNERYDYFNNNNQKKIIKYLDINAMIETIKTLFDLNGKPIKKKENKKTKKNKTEQEPKVEAEVNSFHEIPNNVFGLGEGEYNNQESNIEDESAEFPNFDSYLEDIYKYDNEKLPRDDIYMKEEISCEYGKKSFINIVSKK